MIRLRTFPRGAFVLWLAALAAPAAAKPHSITDKTDLSVARTLRSGAKTVRVIITVDDAALRLKIRESLRAHGDTIKSDHPAVGSIAAEIHSSDVAQLADYPGVRFISADAPVHAGSAPADWTSPTGSSAGGPFGGLTTLPGSTLRLALGLSPVATFGPTGRGIGVALVDSGIAPGFDFGGRITAFYDFTKGGIPSAPYDDYGHGTHVAGLIGSNGIVSAFQLQGVAPEVTFVGLKVLDSHGQGSTSDVLKAIEYVIANRQRLGVQIINLSLGHPIYAAAADDPLVQAVERATASGLIVVVSAGNFGQNPTTGTVGYGGVTSPGNAPSAITVGCAVTQQTPGRSDDRVASYSSRGPTWYDASAKPDLVAPGHALVSDAVPGSTLYKMLPASRTRAGFSTFLQLSGTSMAAAVTTGVVALVLDANVHAQYQGAALTPNLVKTILEYSATPLSDETAVPYDALTQGTGEVNAQGAISLASAIDTSANAGSVWLRNSVPEQMVTRGTVTAWSRAILWGSNLVTGDILSRMNGAFAANVVWGDAAIDWSGTAQIAATNLVWGSAQVWATDIVWGNNLVGMMADGNIVWGNSLGTDNIVWGNLRDDNIVWGNLYDDNIVWGNADDNIIWGNSLDNIVWGNGAPGGIF